MPSTVMDWIMTRLEDQEAMIVKHSTPRLESRHSLLRSLLSLSSKALRRK